jgi:hypothetical protein
MRKLITIIILAITAISCDKKIEKPIWLNQTSVISYNDIAFRFKTNEQDLQAILITSIQPINLKADYQNGVLKVYPINKGGIIEGKAQIFLRNKKNSFFYDVEIKNDTQVVFRKEYRSPKTLNPDSSLLQQSIVYDVDEFRNLSTNNKESLFFEDNFKVSSKAGTYQTEENNPLNAYYVQAGSCVNINILHKKIMDKNIIQVFTGPLLDNFNNLIADGTLVTFYYQNDYTSTITATTLSGYAQVEIPFSKGLTIYAQINQLKSNLLKIK